MSNRISFIFYEKANLPRYYEINKKIFQLALYGFPTISILCLSGLLLMGVYIKKTPSYTPKIETTHNDTLKFKTQYETLAKENRELQEINQQLQTKLATTPASSQVGGIWIEEAPNSKKQSSTSLAIESPKAFIKNKKIRFHFNLSNQLENKVPLKGFVHVIMKKGNELLFWPRSSLSPLRLTAPYNSGEAFSTRYFRPVLSSFPLPSQTSNNEQKYLFVVIVYNTIGDLIHREHITQKVDIK